MELKERKDFEQLLKNSYFSKYFEQEIFYTLFKQEKEFLNTIGYLLFFYHNKTYLYEKKTGKIAVLKIEDYLQAGDVFLFLDKNERGKTLGRTVGYSTSQVDFTKTILFKKGIEKIDATIFLKNGITLYFIVEPYYLSIGFQNEFSVVCYDFIVNPQQKKYFLYFDNIKGYRTLWNVSNQYFCSSGYGLRKNLFEVFSEEEFLNKMVKASRTELIFNHVKDALYIMNQCIPNLAVHLKNYPILGNYQDILYDLEEVPTHKIYKKKIKNN